MCEDEERYFFLHFGVRAREGCFFFLRILQVFFSSSSEVCGSRTGAGVRDARGRHDTRHGWQEWPKARLECQVGGRVLEDGVSRYGEHSKRGPAPLCLFILRFGCVRCLVVSLAARDVVEQP